MSTAELNSNGENDKKPAKEKDTSTIPLSVLYRTYLNGKNVVSNGINFYRGFIYKGSAIEEEFECSRESAMAAEHLNVDRAQSHKACRRIKSERTQSTTVPEPFLKIRSQRNSSWFTSLEQEQLDEKQSSWEKPAEQNGPTSSDEQSSLNIKSAMAAEHLNVDRAQSHKACRRIKSERTQSTTVPEPFLKIDQQLERCVQRAKSAQGYLYEEYN
ncbi:Ycf2 [Dorcoceras hygrometricum]|uniref:Ycf2 n=1 Tax=Dorcoceras hygrometricum TaxID=472368 RepID=A0A2Z7B1Z7_9LAMI|nr:Ycf2 [Dorcoceras hygrometricum]